MFNKKIFSTLIFFFINAGFMSSPNYKDGVPAIGFQYDSGAAWAVVCTNTPYGRVPGKMDGRGGVYFPWGWKEHRCNSWDLVHGVLIHHSMPLPANCNPRGHQNNDNADYYNAVIDGPDGMIPGKASADLRTAWYSYGGRETPVNSGFYIIC